MSTALDASVLRSESLPVAVIVGFWSALSLPVAQFSTLALGLRAAGLVLALGYVAVRGAILARTIGAGPAPYEPRAIVHENVRILLAAGAWFLSAFLVYALSDLLFAAVLEWSFGPARLLVDTLGFVLTATGVGTVVLYAVAVAAARTGGRTVTETDSTTDPDAAVND